MAGLTCGPVATMAHTYIALHVHIVFATVGHRHTIPLHAVSDLHAYLAGIARKRGCRVHQIGGITDHVHALLEMRADLCVSELVRDLKSASSGMLHENGVSGFGWQRGYSAFSVSRSQLPRVEAYVRNQRLNGLRKISTMLSQ